MTVRARWWRLPSGARFHSPTKPHARAVQVDAAGDEVPALSAEGLSAVLGDTVVKVHAAISAGERAESDRLLRHAVHLGVAPTDLLLAFGDQPVQSDESGPPVGADVDLELTADTPEAGEVPPVDGGPAADDETDVGQGPKATRRRGTKAADST